jgi:hypothetical protein
MPRLVQRLSGQNRHGHPRTLLHIRDQLLPLRKSRATSWSRYLCSLSTVLLGDRLGRTKMLHSQQLHLPGRVLFPPAPRLTRDACIDVPPPPFSGLIYRLSTFLDPRARVVARARHHASSLVDGSLPLQNPQRTMTFQTSVRIKLPLLSLRQLPSPRRRRADARA